MGEIWIPVAIVGGLGLFFGLVLAFASKKFEVKVDERIAMIRDLLPGANCAGCGQTGCDAFAEAVVAGICGADGCPVGGNEVASKICEIMGTQEVNITRKIARVMCGGSNDVTGKKYDYEGIEDCLAASLVYAGPEACPYGCVGMGNCVRACPFEAIVIENGLAKVIASKCTGCGKCVVACPKNIIKLVPLCHEYTVRCSSLDRGAVVRQYCKVGCIGCGRCVKVCQPGAITLDGGTLARINPDLCNNCGECIKVCPTASIKQFKCAEMLGLAK